MGCWVVWCPCYSIPSGHSLLSHKEHGKPLQVEIDEPQEARRYGVPQHGYVHRQYNFAHAHSDHSLTNLMYRKVGKTLLLILPHKETPGSAGSVGWTFSMFIDLGLVHTTLCKCNPRSRGLYGISRGALDPPSITNSNIPFLEQCHRSPLPQGRICPCHSIQNI